MFMMFYFIFQISLVSSPGGYLEFTQFSMQAPGTLILHIILDNLYSVHTYLYIYLYYTCIIMLSIHFRKYIYYRLQCLLVYAYMRLFCSK